MDNGPRAINLSTFPKAPTARHVRPPRQLEHSRSRSASPDAVAAEANPGDAIIHSSFIVHWSTANRSARPRRAISFFYWAKSSKGEAIGRKAYVWPRSGDYLYLPSARRAPAMRAAIGRSNRSCRRAPLQPAATASAGPA